MTHAVTSHAVTADSKDEMEEEVKSMVRVMDSEGLDLQSSQST